ncbi:MAG: CRISPR system precrRNA processing endoribonuclease RAMP protein Cas6 [Syntrophaceae bacterium]|nr:CRISPR system precrRNA processing endoribonuclease RAMP protein Cas6 [Syntrophaceae bacterium]
MTGFSQEENPAICHFRAARFLFDLQAITPIRVPEYKGATFRGGFGYAFRKVVCALKNKECRDCLLKEKCIYSYVFETPPPSDTRIMRKYPAAPHPFVLCPPLEDDRIYEPGEFFRFHLTLIGKAIDYLPYFIYSIEELGKMGLGRGKGNFSLEEVRVVQSEGASEEKGSEQSIYSGKEKILRPGFQYSNLSIKPSALPASGSPIHFLFLTPTRLKFREELTSELSFHVFFRSLLRRIFLLSYFHCGKPLEVNFRGLIKEAESVQTLKDNLYWRDWERYSTRQENRMKLGGFMGRIAFSGDLKPFWPYLILGELVHVGKGSSFGLGKYEILNKIQDSKFKNEPGKF